MIKLIKNAARRGRAYNSARGRRARADVTVKAPSEVKTGRPFLVRVEARGENLVRKGFVARPRSAARRGRRRRLLGAARATCRDGAGGGARRRLPLRTAERRSASRTG